MSAVRSDPLHAIGEGTAEHAPLERADEAWLLLNAETRILDLNPIACRLLGKKRSALLGRPLGDSPLTPQEGSWAQVALALGDGTSARFRATSQREGKGRSEVQVALHRSAVGGIMLLFARAIPVAGSEAPAGEEAAPEPEATKTKSA